MGEGRGPGDAAWWIERFFGESVDPAMAVIGVAVLIMAIFTVVAWVVFSACMTPIASRAGFAHPVLEAWTPLRNLVLPFQLAGFVGAWKWAGIVLVAWLVSIPLLFVPVAGFVLPLLIGVFTLVGSFFMALGLQAGLGLRSANGGFVPGAVLLILLPPVWLIWMSVRSRKVDGYDYASAHRYGGGSFPLLPSFACAEDPWSGIPLSQEAYETSQAVMSSSWMKSRAMFKAQGSLAGPTCAASAETSADQVSDPVRDPESAAVDDSVVEPSEGLESISLDLPEGRGVDRSEFRRPDEDPAEVAVSLDDDDWS